MYKIILMCFMSLALLSSNAYAKNTRWCMYNNFKHETGEMGPFLLNYTVSVEEIEKKCKQHFKIKIYQRQGFNPLIGFVPTNDLPKHGIPECAFPVRVCAKKLCTVIKDVGSYIIYNDGGVPVSDIKYIKEKATKPNCK